MDRLAGRDGPCGIHQIGAAHAGGKRKSAGEGFAEADQIGKHAGVFAGEPFSRAAKAGVNLVENEQRTKFVAQFSQQRQEFQRRNVDAAARLDRLDENRADLFAAEKSARMRDSTASNSL